MIGSNFWKDNIQKDNIEKRTYVVFDGVDLSQYITNYSMNDFLDLDGKSSVYGAIGVREISISILGNHPKYNQVTIHHGIKVDDVWVDELLGTFNLLEPTYDEGAKETIYKTDANQYDELVTSTITTGSTPIEYLEGQSVIQVDSTDWTLGDEIIVSSPDTAFYETYKEMAIDMGKSTMSFGIPRYDKLAYRNFTDIDYRVDWVFELKQGEVMSPVNRLNLTTTLGDNVTQESTSMEDGTMLEINNVELIRNNREENSPMMFGEVEGLSYQEMTLEYTGDPFIELGDIITLKDENDVDIKLYVTRHEFKDNGAFSGILHAQILTAEESHTNFVGEWNKLITKTVAEVDKVNQTITLLIERLDDANETLVSLELSLEGIIATVENISFGNIIGNFNPENYLGWEGGSRLLYVAEYSKLRYLSGLTYAMGFQPVKFPQSLSEWGLSFFNNGSATSPFGYVVPTEEYSYRAKVQRFKPFSIDLLEFKDMVSPFHKSTRFTFNNPQAYVQFTSALDPQTVFVRIKFNVTGVTPNDRLEITENMYNRGAPKEYFVSGTEALVYAQSNIQILSDGIKLNSEAVDTLSNDIHNAGVEINAINGVTTYGKKFEVMSEDRTETYMKVTDEGLFVSGNIEAGTVGDLSISDGILKKETTKQTKTYTSSDLTRMQSIILENIIPTASDYENYDINRDGKISIFDYATIKSLIDTGNNPATLRYQIELGSKDSSLVTETKIDNVDIDSKTEILGSKITTGYIQLTELYPRNSYKSSINMGDDSIWLNSNNRKSSLILGSSFGIDNITYEDSVNLDADGVVYVHGSAGAIVNSLGELDLASSGNAILRSWSSNVILDSGSGRYTYNRGLGFRPQTTNTQYLGTSDGRWINVYLQNQPNVSSDTRYKSSIEDIDPILLEIIHEEVKPKTYNTIYDDKNHFGYIAQDVERALYKYCLQKYGKERAIEEVKMFAMLSKDESYMSLLYGELSVLMDAYNRSRIDELEEKLTKLESML